MIDKQDPTWKTIQQGLSLIRDLCHRVREENNGLREQLQFVQEKIVDQLHADNKALRENLKPCPNCLWRNDEIKKLTARVAELETLTVSLTTQIVDLNASKEAE